MSFPCHYLLCTHSLSLILSSACIFINLLCDRFSETVGNNEMAGYRLWNLIELGLNSPSSLLFPGLRPQILRPLISEQGQWSQPASGDRRNKWESHTQSICQLAPTSAQQRWSATPLLHLLEMIMHLWNALLATAHSRHQQPCIRATGIRTVSPSVTS